jgi:acetoin utilization protein AcuA
MDKISSSVTILPTPNGNVRIRSFCSPSEIRKCTFDRQFAFHDHYKSLYASRELLERAAEQTEANIVLALAKQNHIIGYAVLAYPEPGERWVELGPGIMMEVTAIEVCRSWRSLKIASAILEMLVAYPQVEDKIVYMIGYSWTWDLSGTRNTAQLYRQMLINLFKSKGFKEYKTNEPNICLKSENLFMCRLGNEISQTIRDRFKWLRFGLSPWTWEVNGH